MSVNYLVYALSAIIDGVSWMASYRQFRRENVSSNMLAAVQNSKNPPAFMVFFEDSAALIGLVIAVVGTFVSSQFDSPVADGLASILIAIVLGSMAGMLAFETKGLLIGEPADPQIVNSIRQIAQGMKGVICVNGVLTLQNAPQEIVVAISLEFEDHLKTEEVEQIIEQIESALRSEHTDVMMVFVKPQTPARYQKNIAAFRRTDLTGLAL